MIGLGLITFFLFGPSLVGLFESSRSGSEVQNQDVDQTQQDANTNQNMANLEVRDDVIGEGAEAVNGSLVTVNYVGTLEDGQKFDSSIDRGEPFQFVLGTGQVIPGWDLGVMGMKEGGKRHLVIPPELAYGQAGVPGAIPAGATLIFDVELLKVE